MSFPGMNGLEPLCSFGPEQISPAAAAQAGRVFSSQITIQAQRPGPWDAPIANRDAPPGLLQRMG